MILASWLHTISPFIWRITENFGIRWYGAAYLAGFAIAYLILMRLAKRELIAVPRACVADAMMWLIGGALIGGRIGYVLFYDQMALWTFTGDPPWWGVLAIQRGGMASHGGMIGIVIGAWRISRGWRLETGEVVGRCSMLHVMDLAGLVAPFGIFLGRVANFINGELLGRVVTPPGVEGPWWTVQFPQELLSGHAPKLSAEQEYSLVGLARRYAEAGDAGITRRAFERLIENAGKHASELKPLLASREPSQLFQAVGEGVVVGLAVWVVWAKARRPGVVAGVFLMTYGVMRIVTEFSRLPDAQFAMQRLWGLSRGQWLSVGMLVAGAGVMYTARRMKRDRIGGWHERRPIAPAETARSE